MLRSTYLFTSLVDLFASANDGQRAALHLYLGADIRVGEQTGSSEASAFTLLDADEQAEVAAFPASTSIQTTYENTDNIVYRLNVADVSEYPFIDALGWFVVAHVSTADAFAVIAQSNLVIVISALLGLGFAAVLGFGVSRLIVSPIHQLTELAKKFSAGEMDTRVPETTRDELGVLAHSFNQMADTVTLRERDLNELNRTLEARVQERTAELRKANALAQESVRLKSEFLSTMSHELRTPLNAMLGYTSLMTEGLAGDFDDDTLDMIERIHKNGQRLLLLINEVLDLARIEAGRMEIVSAPFDLHDMAGQWKSQMEVLAQEKGLDFTVTVDDKLPAQIVGDKDRITQIVVNLLSNAFKFTEKGAVDLTITGRTNSWVISVADTGIGIPPHALNYIFDEFRQVDGSSKRMYGGSGLGLAIVRNLCRLLNGKVSVTSEVGLGSVFTVTLPLEVSVAEMPGRNGRGVSTMSAIAKDVLKGWKVLVVDDEPDSLDVARRILTIYGAEVQTGTNGQEGLQIVRKWRPDFIISDLSMPVMDGWGFLFELKDDRSTTEIPVIALTAHAMIGDRERGIAAGFHNYMTKPLTVKTFMHDLLRLLVDIPELSHHFTPELTKEG
ncbi:MAG: response regulator [Chloroflexi bacterium]|nr:response regulator [Chloroflexota bacterium]